MGSNIKYLLNKHFQSYWFIHSSFLLDILSLSLSLPSNFFSLFLSFNLFSISLNISFPLSPSFFTSVSLLGLSLTSFFSSYGLNSITVILQGWLWH